MKLGFVLKDLIERRGYSQSRLAREAAVNPKSLSDWLAHRTPRDLNAVRRVARVLGVSLSYLLFGEEESSSSRDFGERRDSPAGVYEVTIRRLPRREMK